MMRNASLTFLNNLILIVLKLEMRFNYKLIKLYTIYSVNVFIRYHYVQINQLPEIYPY